MKKAKRLAVDGMRSTVGEGFYSLWEVEGEVGIFRYDRSYTSDYQTKDDEVLASANGIPAIFKREVIVEKAVCRALKISYKDLP